MMFSLEQVRDIVQRTVDERERVLREHYDRVLQQKLQGACSTSRVACLCPSATSRSPLTLPIRLLACAEQWQSFAKFNEDYVSRSLKSSDLSYCS
tara:strand:- start:558 stop:842 length:285 start_codon:yes stop_codon:yes gene_type:complete